MKLKSDYEAVVIGGGQAGLSASVCLKNAGIDHVVLERHRIGHAWRSQRWDNFCLVTPNWQCTLPEFNYDKEYGGDDPDGFMTRDQIVQYIEAFRTTKKIPVVEGIDVKRLSAGSGGFRLDYSHLIDSESGNTENTIESETVIIATGGYHAPRLPALSSEIPTEVVQIHSSEYKNAEQLPEGEVLVVGTGQSGCQIAEDLHLEDRQVHLAVGSAPRSPRFYRGRDVTAWLVDMGAYDVTVDEHPLGADVRKKTNHYLTGRDGGREIDLRRFATEGMQLHGRLLEIENQTLQFGDDLSRNLDNADASYERIKSDIDKYIQKHNLDYPLGSSYESPWEPEHANTSLPLNKISSIVWCTGFNKDYHWVELDAFDDLGEPIYERGVSTKIPGLYFLGLPWMHTWGSGRFSGVASDAAHVVKHAFEQLNQLSVSR